MAHHQGLEVRPLLRTVTSDHPHRLLRVPLFPSSPLAHQQLFGTLLVAGLLLPFARLLGWLLLAAPHARPSRCAHAPPLPRPPKNVLWQLLRPLPLLVWGHPQLDEFMDRQLPLPPMLLLLFGAITPFIAAIRVAEVSLLGCVAGAAWANQWTAWLTPGSLRLHAHRPTPTRRNPCLTWLTPGPPLLHTHVTAPTRRNPCPHALRLSC